MPQTLKSIAAILFAAALLTACTHRPAVVTFAHGLKLQGPSPVARVAKLGDYVALENAKGQALKVTENDFSELAESLPEAYDAQRFFDAVFNDGRTKEGADLTPAVRAWQGLTDGWYMEKHRYAGPDQVLYLWRKQDDRLIGILLHTATGYYLNIIAEGMPLNACKLPGRAC